MDGVISHPETEMMDTSAMEEDKPDRPEEMSDETADNGTAKKLSIIPILEPLQEDSIEGHAFNFVNDVKLSDFKLVLSKNNIPSEFQGGVLFCGGGLVALRRHESGRVTIEGCVCDEYYQVRELLYEQYAIL